jgi:hypothetical protein
MRRADRVAQVVKCLLSKCETEFKAWCACVQALPCTWTHSHLYLTDLSSFLKTLLSYAKRQPILLPRLECKS